MACNYVTERCTNVEMLDPSLLRGMAIVPCALGGLCACRDLVTPIGVKALLHHDLTSGKSTARVFMCDGVTCKTCLVSGESATEGASENSES